MNNHACQDCGWCHDFFNYGYCTNPKARKQNNSDNKLTFEELINDNHCNYFDDDTWFGG